MQLLYFIAMYGAEFIGQEIHRELLREMQARGHAVSVFALAGREQRVAAHQPEYEEGIPVFRARVDRRLSDRLLNRAGKPIFIYDRFLSGARYYFQHVMTNPPDLAHVELAYPMGAMAALPQLLARRPFAVHIGGGDLLASTEAGYGYARYRVARALLRWTFGRAALVRAVSPHAADMARRLGCPPDKLVVIPRNISRNSFPPQEISWQAFREQARIRIDARHAHGEALTIVASGRLLPIKGFDFLIRALPQVRAAVGPVRLLLVGPDRGNYGQRLTNLAQIHGVGDGVILTGAVDKREMRDYLAAADLVAVPSIEEGGNKIVLEAAAVGTPFVATDLTGTPDYAEGWDCGLTVPPRDVTALANGLIELARNPARRQAMGSSGTRLACHFAPEPVAERLLKLYEYVLKHEPIPDALRVLSPANP